MTESVSSTSRPRNHLLFNPQKYISPTLPHKQNFIQSQSRRKVPETKRKRYRQDRPASISISMASILSTVGATLSYKKAPTEGLKQSTRGGTQFKSLSFGGVSVKPRRVAVAVRAESQGINPEIRKSEDKVVDSVVVTELSKPLTAYCR